MSWEAGSSSPLDWHICYWSDWKKWPRKARMSTLGTVGRTRRRDKNILKWSRTGSDKYSTIKWWETKRRQKCLQLNNNDKEHKERGANRKTRSQQWFLMTKDWWSKLKNSDRELHYFKTHTQRTSLMEFSSDKRILRQFRRLLQIRHDEPCAWTNFDSYLC